MSPKKKGFKTTWIVVSLFVILGAVSVYLEKQDKVNRGKIKIYNMTKDDIRSFELVNGKTGETVACERYGAADWGMFKPRAYETEKSEVEMVVNNLAALTIDRKIDKPEILANYGLEKPDYTANFTLKNGRKQALLIGSKNPTGTFYYIKDKDSKEVYIGYGFSMEAVMKSAKDLRKKSLFDLNMDMVNKIDLKYETREFSLSMGEDKKWAILPYNFPGSKEETEKLLNVLKELKALDFAEDDAKDLKKYGLDRPRLSLTVSRTGGKPVNVLVGKKNTAGEGDYAKIESSGVVYIINSEFLTGTEHNYNDFREKKLFTLKEDEFNELDIIEGKTLYSASRDKDNKFVLKSKKNADFALANLVREFMTAQVVSFVDDSGKKFEKYGLKTPKYIVLAYNNVEGIRKPKVKLLIGDENGKTGRYVRVEQDDSVVSISKELTKRIEEVIKIAVAK